MKFTAIEHADVTGKILYYLKLENDGHDPLLINVGEKTYRKTVAMSTPKTQQPQLFIQDEQFPEEKSPLTTNTTQTTDKNNMNDMLKNKQAKTK